MTFHWVTSKHPISIQTKLKTYAYLIGKKVDKVVIFMHGFGDNAENASQFGHALHLEHVLFLFVQGPQSIPMNFSGFQWFNLFHDSHKKIDESAALVLELFNHLTTEHTIPCEKIYFMGFSQGAAMALYCGLQTKQKIGGIVSLSGFMIHTAKLLEQKKSLHTECPLLLMHGDEDQTIFPILFFEAQTVLAQFGFTNILTKLYPMGHNVCTEEITQIKNFLMKP